MRFVASRIRVTCLVVADDRVVPIGNIDRPVRTHRNVYGTKGLVRRFDQLGHLGRRVASPIVAESMRLHNRPEVATDYRNSLQGFRQGSRSHDVQCGRLRRGLEQVTNTVILLCRIRRRTSRIFRGPDHRRLELEHHARRRPVTLRTIARFVEHLPVIIEGDAPAIRARHRSPEETLQASLSRPIAPKPRPIHTGDTAWRFHSGNRMQALRHPNASVRTERHAVYQLMRVPHSEPGKDNFRCIRFAIAIRVAQEKQAVEVAHVGAVSNWLDPLDHGQTFRKAPRTFRNPISISVFQHNDVIARRHARETLRIGRRARHPHATLGIPGNLNRIYDVPRLRSEEIDREAFRHLEGIQLSSSRERRFNSAPARFARPHRQW